MVKDNLEQVVFDGWTRESTISSIETAKYFRNGFLSLGLGSIALGVTALTVGHDPSVGLPLIGGGLPLSAACVWAESMRSSESARLEIFDRLSPKEDPPEAHRP